MDKKLVNYAAMAAAIVVAFVIVGLVKYFLIPTTKASGLTEVIIWLETAIMILIMSAFAVNEVVKVGEKIAGKKSGDSGRHAPSEECVSPFSLLVALGASVLILLAATTWISHWIPGQQ